MEYSDQPFLLCMGCMEPLETRGAVCPCCGYDNTAGANASHQLPIRTILAGKYLIGRALGQGGFGVTYIGWDLNLDVKVAIKEYYPEGFASRELTGHATVLPYTGPKEEAFRAGCERFVREAKTIARFADYPAIVNVRDYFRENGTAYIVMEYVAGLTMQQYAKKRGGKLPAAETLQLLKPLFYSLSQIHAADLLHRDISPDNIILKPNGMVKLLDFGAARQISMSGEHSNTINVKHGYAPEEQYRTHGKQGPWTDVYALCATIYRLTTGVTPPQAMDRAMADLPLIPPNTLCADFTPAQQETLLCGLAVRASDRVQSMDELERGLYGEASNVPTAVGTTKTNEQTPAEAVLPHEQAQQTHHAAERTEPEDASLPAKKRIFPTHLFLKKSVRDGKMRIKWYWVAAGLLLLCGLSFWHIQGNLMRAEEAFQTTDFRAADRHMRLTVIGNALFDDYRTIAQAGMLTLDKRYDEAIKLLEPYEKTTYFATFARQETEYRKAKSLLEAKQYEQAFDLYASLDNYKQSVENGSEACLSWFCDLTEHGSYSEATKLIGTVEKEGFSIPKTYQQWM